MTKEFEEPANSNQSFYGLLYNPKKAMFESTIFSALRLSRAAEVPRTTLAEVLFDNAMNEVVPKGEMNKAKSTIWYGQLLRFRDKIDAMITQMETPQELSHSTPPNTEK